MRSAKDEGTLFCVYDVLIRWNVVMINFEQATFIHSPSLYRPFVMWLFDSEQLMLCEAKVNFWKSERFDVLCNN